MEDWNNGISGMRSFFIYGTYRILKSGYNPLFLPNIPSFRHSIISLVILLQTSPLWGEISAWPSGPGFFSSNEILLM
jgi:hypothetical protein